MVFKKCVFAYASLRYWSTSRSTLLKIKSALDFFELDWATLDIVEYNLTCLGFIGFD